MVSYFLSQFATNTSGPFTMTLCLFLIEAFECFTFAVPDLDFLLCRGFAMAVD